MSNQILKISIFSLLFLCFAFSAQAANLGDVVINEVAWMGTEASYADEWIELYNNTDSPINLESWILKAVDGTPEINLAGIVPAKGFYLLERTDDNTVSDISADQIYKGALGNNGENLELYDSSSNLIDSVNCSDGWLGGNNVTKQTMERTSSDDWQTSQNPGGTPKTENSSPSTEVALPTTEETSAYHSDVVINEVLPSPTEPDDKEESYEAKPRKIETVVDEQIPKAPVSFPVFLIAVIVAVFSGAIILTLKKKLKIS